MVEELPPGVEKVYLQKQGEPFLHPRLEEYAAHLKAKRPTVRLAFHTNGILAKRARLARLLPLVDALGFSISATDEPTYRRAHGTGAFRVVMRNLRDLSELLLAMPPDRRPHVFVDYVAQAANAHEAEAATRDFFLTRFPGLASVDFHWVYNFQGEIAEGNLAIYDQVPQAMFPACVFPWASFTVCHDGKASYCFVEPRENAFLGDLSRQGFREIWEGAPYRAFREAMAARRFDRLAELGMHCRRCSWLWSMRSQSPANLAGGYLPPGREESVPRRLGELLELMPEKVLELAARSYLGGEPLEALGRLALLERLRVEPDLAAAAGRLGELCRALLDRYREVFAWRRVMNGGGDSAALGQCRYYPRKAAS